MPFYIDIEDANAVKQGSGPITSATGWNVQRRMDQAGDWSFQAPLSDVKLAQATPRRYAHIYALISNVWTWVGGGPIDSIKTVVGADGKLMAEVSGSDLVRELAWRSVGNLTISDGSGGPTTHSAAVASVAAFAPTGWTITADSAPGWDSVYGQFGGESVLTALTTIADRSRSHFYLSGKRTLTFASTFTDSTARGIQANADLGAGTTAITSLNVDASSYDLFSRIIPLGSGQARVALTLLATTRTAAAGYTLSAANNYLVNNTTETAYGRCERTVAFKDISPISNTTADVIAAANALFDAAEYWLATHGAPVTSYRVTVVECPVLLRPLQTIRVMFRDPDAGIDIDDDLQILAVQWTGDTDGVRTAQLTVADSGQWPESDVGAMVQSIADGEVYQAHPQLNANSYVIAYTKNLDEDRANPAEFRFRFDEEVTQLTRTVFDFQLLPLESTVKSVASASATSSSGGGTTATSTSGGSSTPTTSSGGGTTATSTSGGGTSTSTDAGGGTSTSTSNGGSSTPTTDSGSGHTHEIDLADSTTGTAVFYAGIGGSGNFRTAGGGTADTSSTGSGHTHDVSISDHSHSFTVPTHAHSFTVGNHAHGVTISDHSHSVTISGHTHDVTISAHTHTVTPTITTTYGIYRDSTGNVFALGDLEYSVDNVTWYYFIPGVNGFASLGDSWYRVDLTALLQNASTLRPNNANNLLQIRRKTAGATGKRTTIDAQMSIRTIIQAIAYI